jgi:hypothetical protein
MRTDKRPIAGIAKFIDIERDASGYLLRLRYYSGVLNPQVDFLLKTSRHEMPKKDWPRFGEDAAQFMAADYIFVARITRVRRDDTSTGGEARRRWIAEGECLDLREAPVPPAPPTGAAKPKSKQPNPIPQ